jgi:hypothetical protein
MRPLGHGGGVAGQNPATSPAVLAGEGAGKVLGVAQDRFGCSLMAETVPAGGYGGGRRRRLLEAVVPASCGSA